MFACNLQPIAVALISSYIIINIGKNWIAVSKSFSFENQQQYYTLGYKPEISTGCAYFHYNEYTQHSERVSGKEDLLSISKIKMVSIIKLSPP